MPLFDRTQVLNRLMKYLGAGQDALSARLIPELWHKAISVSQIQTFEQEISIEGFYSIFNPFAKQSQAVNRLLAGCHSVVLLIATLGPDLEKTSKIHLDQHQLFPAYVLDRMGSFIVESAMRNLNQQISRLYKKKGESCTIRYSPGYQDFDLACQKIFVRLAQAELPVLIIEPNGCLKPEKTITAIKGVYRA
ncbi:MAG: hypothetical protein KKE62_12170 [Proteobacteria bacterium]|nr:hypothetical protein [Pseudomonadota bacterium]MBU1389034.1 hypothetical protein [Pseudomonadota bacterium]MBU1543586.1 hypothetical protein [Pseudomonadota bacterium]MBU2431800.1 hypothetical protein [Pseudomonadota bacterium]MBU2481937.1 hypothetical protein [Pseudomonadota bacterium]